MTLNDNRTRRRGGAIATVVASVALLLAILALILTQCTARISAISSPTPCPTATIAQAVDGLSAYELWKSVGNTGTLDDFLQSLVGEQGSAGKDGSVIYVGNPGFAGPNGTNGVPGLDGASAYQLWLDAGNVGTSDDFLASLIGVDGATGPSAYDVWVAIGNDGQTEQDFIDFLVGPQGPIGPSGDPGAPGETGKSAYDIWLELPGHSGSEANFINSLIGAQGEQGIPGTCTIGDTGATGPAGPQGEIGPTGPAGADGVDGLPGSKGDTGATGPQGPAGTGGLGDTGSFFDLSTQGWDSSPQISHGIDTAFPVYLNETDAGSTSGISVVHGTGDANSHKSYITFTNPGVYNIAFSAQLYRSQGGSTIDASFWLRKNGVNVPATNTDVTLQAGAGKLVAAWNFFVPVVCDPTCDTYQLMWSYDDQYVNIWYQIGQTNPTRPEIPSIILTVNQVR